MGSWSGDVSAFAELYRRHSRAVLRYAWGKLGREDLSEEAMQDTFVVAWENEIARHSDEFGDRFDVVPTPPRVSERGAHLRPLN